MPLHCLAANTNAAPLISSLQHHHYLDLRNCQTSLGMLLRSEAETVNNSMRDCQPHRRINISLSQTITALLLIRTPWGGIRIEQYHSYHWFYALKVSLLLINKKTVKSNVLWTPQWCARFSWNLDIFHVNWKFRRHRKWSLNMYDFS